MLNTVKVNNLIDDRLRRLFTKIDQLEEKLEEQNLDLVECETCGCLLKKESAYAGEKVIKHRDRKTERLSPISQIAGPSYPPIKISVTNEEDYLHQTYYCKIHFPKIDNDKPVKILPVANASMSFSSGFCHKECSNQIAGAGEPYMLPIQNGLEEVTHLRCAACEATIKL